MPGHPEGLDLFCFIHKRLADHDEIRDLKSAQSSGMVAEFKRTPVKPRVDIEPVIAGVMIFGF